MQRGVLAKCKRCENVSFSGLLKNHKGERTKSAAKTARAAVGKVSRQCDISGVNCVNADVEFVNYK